MKQLERMFGEDASSALTFSSHRWGEQSLTSGNGGGTGGGHDDMGDPDLRVPFVSPTVVVDGTTPRTLCLLSRLKDRAVVVLVKAFCLRSTTFFQTPYLDNGKFPMSKSVASKQLSESIAQAM